MLAFSLRRLSRPLACAVALSLCASAARAAEIKILASNAVKETYTRLIPDFEKSSGHHVTVVWGGTADIMRDVRAGEVQDIVITTAASIDTLTKEGKLAQSRVDLAKSIIGVASRPGAPKPNLTSGETLKQSLLASKKIILSGGPSGVYLADLFKKMGIAEQIKSKTITLAPGASPGEAVARGEGDIGFTQVSELLAVKGIDYLGPIPADVQQIVTFSAGLNPKAPQPDAAKALLKFLTSPAAAPTLKKTGLEPSS